MNNKKIYQYQKKVHTANLLHKMSTITGLDLLNQPVNL